MTIVDNICLYISKQQETIFNVTNTNNIEVMGMLVALIWSYAIYMYYHIALYPVNIYNYMPIFY